MFCHRSCGIRPLLCLLRRYFDTFSTCNAEHTCYQFGSPRALVVGGNRVHDNAGVDIGIDNPDSGNMLDGTFTNSMKIGNGVEENDKVGDNALILRRFRSKEMDLVCEGPREPLFTDVVGLWAYALGSFEDGGAKVGTSANKDDGPISRCDSSHERSCATKMGEGTLEVYDDDIRARSIRIWNEVWVKQGSVMTEVCSSGEKSGKRQVAWGYCAVQRMMRLPCIISRLGRAKFRKNVDWIRKARSKGVNNGVWELEGLTEGGAFGSLHLKCSPIVL